MTHVTDDVDTPFVPAINLDRSSPVPLYHQIAEPLETLIRSGTLQPGQMIEDEVSMAQRLAISRPTARRALQDLVNRGLLSRRRGVGTRVTPSHVRRTLSLTSLNDDLLKAGFTPHTQVLSYDVRLASEDEAEVAGCKVGDEMVRIERLRFIDDRPLAVLTNLIPTAFAPSLTQLTSKGLYACFNDQGVRPASAQQVVGARLAEPEEAKRLGIEAGDALLTMQRTAYSQDGQVIEYGTHYYNAKLYSFDLTLLAD